MSKFDPEAFGKQMAQVVKAAVNQKLGDLERRIASLEASRMKDLETEVQRLRGRVGDQG